MVATLFEMTQDFADRGNTQKVMELLEGLLVDFQERLHQLQVANDAEIELYNNVKATQQEIL